MILNSILPENTPVSSINEEKAPKEEGFGDDLELEDEKGEEA